MQKKLYLLSAIILCSMLRLSAQFAVQLPDQNVACGQTITIPVTVENFTDLTTLQFSINWDVTDFSFNSAEITIPDSQSDLANIGSSNAASNGILTFSWLKAASATLSDGDTILLLSLDVAGNNFNTADIIFSDNSTVIEASVAGLPVEVITNNGTYTLQDIQQPVITCPSDQTSMVTGTNSSISITDLTPITSDNCGVDTIRYELTGATTGFGMDDASNRQFNIGVTTLSYIVEDFKGNSNQCAATITVNNAVATDSLIISLDDVLTSCTGIIAIPIRVMGFDSITNLSMNLDWDSDFFNFLSVGDFMLGGLSIGDFDLDQTATGMLGLNWSNVDPQVLAEGGSVFTLRLNINGLTNQSPVNISGLSAQRNGVDFTASGVNGTITVQDNTSPDLSCPANVIIEAPLGEDNVAVSDIAPMVFDDCSNISVNYQLSGATILSGTDDASGTRFNIGTTMVTYEAVNQAGLSTTCTFDVTITEPNPTIFTLAAQSKTADCSAEDIAIDINVGAFTDILSNQFSINWDPDILTYTSHDNVHFSTGINFGPSRADMGIFTYSWFDNDLNGETLPNGMTLFTLHFKPNNPGLTKIDFTDNTTPIEISQKVDGTPTVIPYDLNSGMVMVIDISPPTLICPSDTIITVNLDQTSAIVNDIAPFVTDNCGLDSLYYTLTGATTDTGDLSASGTAFNIGTTKVTYTAVDKGGNRENCSFDVRVTNPDAVLIKIEDSTADCGEEAFRVDVKADNFVNMLSLQFSLDWNESILMLDTIGNFGLPDLNIGNFGLSGSESGRITFSWFDGDLSGETLPPDAVLFSMYFKVISVGATDILVTDNPTTREASVKSVPPTPVPVDSRNGQIIALDNSSPTISNCVDTVLQYITATNCKVAGAWPEPIFEDFCSDLLSLQRTHNLGDTFEIGQRTVTYRAIDPSGNVAECSFLHLVRDTIKPVIINCPADISIDAGISCDAAAAWAIPTATDNCSDVILSATHSPGDIFPGGTTLVTYTATDAYGNTSQCTFTVTVTGVAPIVFDNCPSNITANSTQGICGANLGWTPPTASGGCSGSNLTLTSDFQPGDLFPVGVTAVTYTARDDAGQSLTCTFLVTVIDDEPFVTLCPTDIEISSDGRIMEDAGNFVNSVTTDTCGAYIITFNNITAFDNCSPISISQTQGLSSGSVFGLGTTMMEFVASDTFGNSNICTFQIKINDLEAITASTSTDPVCAGTDVQLLVDSLEGGIYQWSGPNGFSTNEQNPIIQNITVPQSGDYIVKLAFANGCYVKDTITFGVRSGPMIEATGNSIGCDEDNDTIRLTAMLTNGIPIETYNWTGPGNYTSDFQNPIIPDATTANAGIYIVTGTSSNGCFDRDTVVVNVVGMVSPTVSSSLVNDTACLGLPFTLRGTAYDDLGIVTYTWLADSTAGAGLPANTDTSIISVMPTTEGVYTYAYVANLDGGCISDTARITIIVNDGGATMAISASTNSPTTCVATDDMINLSVSDAPGASWIWAGPNGFTSNQQSPSVTPLSNASAGNYIVIATFTNGCTATDTLNINLSVRPDAPNVTPSATMVCEGDAFSLSADTVLGARYAWIGPNGFTSEEIAVSILNATTQDAGAYQLTITQDSCTSSPRTVGPISVLSDPIVVDDNFEGLVDRNHDFNVLTNDTLTAGGAFTINIISNVVNGTLTDNGNGAFTYRPNTSFVGMDQMAYELCYDACPNLCGMATVTIRTDFSAVECIAPTLLTPNNDGLNDAFIISCVPDPPKEGSELTVFNEWGSEVFRQSPYQNNWDGTYEGKPLPDGTYFYVFKEDSDDNDPKKGYVTIFR